MEIFIFVGINLMEWPTQNSGDPDQMSHSLQNFQLCLKHNHLAERNFSGTVSD